MEITLKKIEELEDTRIPNNIEVGYIQVGEFVAQPKIGEPFYVGNRFRTSRVKEIIDENTFRTHNSIYQWSKRPAKPKVYISGKITGLPIDEARFNFQEAERSLNKLGYEPVNPFNNGLTVDHTWLEHMKADLKLLLDCDMICLLSNWKDSRGAKMELDLAKKLGYKVITI